MQTLDHLHCFESSSPIDLVSEVAKACTSTHDFSAENTPESMLAPDLDIFILSGLGKELFASVRYALLSVLAAHGCKFKDGVMLEKFNYCFELACRYTATHDLGYYNGVSNQHVDVCHDSTEEYGVVFFLRLSNCLQLPPP